MENKKIKNLVYDAMFIALLAIFTFVPYLGLYSIGTISFTLLHIIVILGASLFGYKRGALYGFVMGFFTLIKALNYPGVFDYFFVNPFVSVLPRTLFGLISGLLFDLLKKYTTQKKFIILMPFVSIICAFLHTFLVVICWYLFGILDPFYISYALGLRDLVNNLTFIAFISSFLIWGSLVEILSAGVIVPILYGTIFKVFKIGSVDEGNFKKVVKNQ